jgi:NADPH:quinone reductase
MAMKAVVMTGPRGRDVLKYVTWPDPVIGPGEVLVQISVSGVNFMDIGVRQGMPWTEPPVYPQPIGVEGAGRVVVVGEYVHEIAVGDRVCWVYAPGSYAELISIPAEKLVPIPDDIDDRTAAAIMMQGLTASHFATDFYPVRSGDVAFVHAAAGGLGQLLTQLIKMRGGSVIGRVSSSSKAGQAEEAGVDHVLVDTGEYFTVETLRLTENEGVDVVYDGSGPTTFQGSLDILRRAGTFCWYGPVLGGPDPIVLGLLPKSIKIGFANYNDHIPTPDLLRAHARRLFNWILDGKIKLRIGAEYALHEAVRAHGDMESRATTGKLLLHPR